MKPEDLIIGKSYLVFDEQREYLGESEGFNEPHYLFDRKTDNFGDRVLLTTYDISYKVKELGEKTMPAARKPEQIRIELTNEETIQALNLLGYDLEGYEFGRGHNLSIFTLNLKKEPDEKTKATT
jgi:hypothetical protein